MIYDSDCKARCGAPCEIVDLPLAIQKVSSRDPLFKCWKTARHKIKKKTEEDKGNPITSSSSGDKQFFSLSPPPPY